jgi:ABC-type branched-subunit amino acid transport system permease subunit
MYYAPTVLHGAFTLDLSLAFLTMMILGGSGSLGGSLLGALIIGLLPQLLQLLPSTIGRVNLQQSVNGVYALLLLLTLRFFRMDCGPCWLVDLPDSCPTRTTQAPRTAGGNRGET